MALVLLTSLKWQGRRRKAPATGTLGIFIREKLLPDIAALTQLIEPEARALGFDLVRVAWFGGEGDRTLQIMAERPATRQLTIDDCASLSRRVSDLIDTLEAEGRDPIDEAYRLEVSSPGIDRPLTRLRDYADWKGHEARVNLVGADANGRKQYKSDLAGVDGESVLLDDPKAGRVAIPFEEIANAKLLLTDRLISATVPLSAEGVDHIQTEEQRD
jgi:ribosome maturation factor RimP